MWLALLDEFSALERFFTSGGDVLIAVFFLTLALWTLILERYCYFFFLLPKKMQFWENSWLDRSDKYSWNARHIRLELISKADLTAKRHLPLIKTLVALCPLLGLLGTVVGMVEVFDALAITGTGSPRAMAAGISRATIPTMAGMVAALSGIWFSARLQKRAAFLTGRFAARLQH
ncbi:biopolymer transporter ExbB [Pelagibaculum spongiae]|uniref:Biopolymer transporter ExbB n=1 Tax=Pelagibaculum spongiae TaxID=2080658 RepID=A0A2V1H050_9GAMM|nr:biopolymer transporter ExbB [Pelagibaculum spongiae]